MSASDSTFCGLFSETLVPGCLNTKDCRKCEDWRLADCQGKVEVNQYGFVRCKDHPEHKYKIQAIEKCALLCDGINHLVTFNPTPATRKLDWAIILERISRVALNSPHVKAWGEFLLGTIQQIEEAYDAKYLSDGQGDYRTYVVIEHFSMEYQSWPSIDHLHSQQGKPDDQWHKNQAEGIAGQHQASRHPMILQTLSLKAANKLSVAQKNQLMLNEMFGNLLGETELLMRLCNLDAPRDFASYQMSEASTATRQDTALNIETVLVTITSYLNKKDKATGEMVYKIPQIEQEYITRLNYLLDTYQPVSNEGKMAAKVLDYVIGSLVKKKFGIMPTEISTAIMSHEDRDRLLDHMVNNDQQGLLAFNNAAQEVGQELEKRLDQERDTDVTGDQDQIRKVPLIDMKNLRTKVNGK